MHVLSMDFETSIGKTVHESTFRDPKNDLYTQIWATHPDKVRVVHCLTGFMRGINGVLAGDLLRSDLLVGHNLSFDLCYVFNTAPIQDFIAHGKHIWDTQLVEYILTGQQHTTASLAELQEKRLGEKVKPSRISALFKKGIGADKILAAKTRCPRLFKLYDYYCHTDGATPLLIFKSQYIEAKQRGMLPIVEMYNDYLLAIINMTCTGVYVDTAKAEELLKEFTLRHLQYLKEAQEVLKSVWTDTRLPEFNLNSPDHKSAVLFGGWIKVIETVDAGFYQNGKPKTKKQEVLVRVPGYGLNTALSRPGARGMYSTDKKVMEAIRLSPDVHEDVITYCNLQVKSAQYAKAANTYCKAFLERAVGDILYPNFNSTITPTGRLSSSQPNMQNIPSKGELAESIMGLLIAPFGWVCCSIDFSQLEKWTQALVSQDALLISNLQSGICMHCQTLAKIEGQSYEDVYRWAKIENIPEWDNKRTAIKPVGFLMDYGGMPKRVALETGMRLEDVEEIYRIDKEMYPDKHNFFENVLPEVVKRSQTISLACNIPASKKGKGKDATQIFGKAELLPIFDKDGKTQYNQQEFRHVGYWSTNYGKIYHFKDNGRINKQGNIQRNFSLPKFKNYPNQGGGADIQGCTTAELTTKLIAKRDSIKMINEIHDSKLFYIREDVLPQAVKWLKETIENVPAIFKRRFDIDIPFRFPVEVKIGANFGEMRKYENYNCKA